MKSIRYIVGTLIGMCLSIPLSAAQEIGLYFPEFSGNSWSLLLLRGQEQDTILRGIIPADGHVVLRLPEDHTNYRGMARWLLRRGGGIDLVINGESFTVSCLSTHPTMENIEFKGSAENDFLIQNHLEQEQLLNQYAAIGMVERAYPPGSPLYAKAVDERKRLEEAWTSFRLRLAASPLYAARFREIVDITRGIGSRMEQSEPEKAMEVNDYICRRMPWEVLYTSNHWAGMIHNWVEMHLLSIRSDEELLAGTRLILARIPQAAIYTSFCEYLARDLVKAGKDSLLTVLGPEVRGSGKLLHQGGSLEAFAALQPGEAAPDLVRFFHREEEGDAEEWLVYKRIVDLAGNQRLLLLFFQSGCDPCQNALEQLAAAYPELQKKGIRVLGISADSDQEVFRHTTSALPWPDNYCDGKGMYGPNFKRYGVVGTPTLFLLDNSGQVRFRHASVAALLSQLQ